MKLNSVKAKRKVVKKQLHYKTLSAKSKPSNVIGLNITEINTKTIKNISDTGLSIIKNNYEMSSYVDNNTNIIPENLVYEIKKIQSSSYSSESKENQPVISYIDPIENFPGNYQTYITKCLKSINNLNALLDTEEINSKFLSYINSNKITLGKTNKKTLILDLDETLIHSDFNYNFGKHDEILYFKTETLGEVEIPLVLRPGVKSFLENVSKKFEIVVFTASKREYANVILDYLDPFNTIFTRRLYRENCIPLFGKIFIKDLRILSDRCPNDMVIVDNSLYSFANQISNGILITSYFSDSNDKELINLENYLLNNLVSTLDIRVENENINNPEKYRTILDIPSLPLDL